MFPFSIHACDGKARTGRLTTPHGAVDTPVFMPVGTAASIKGVTPGQLTGTGSSMILANTYHLNLRPGADVVKQLGGLHSFMGFAGPMLTDSGGYQVFSLSGINRVDDDGVSFQSHIDGSRLRLDPATAISIQESLGADVIMAFDQCPPLPCPQEVLVAAVDRTIRWARTCRELHRRENQDLFGIVQGGLDPGLRVRCAAELLKLNFSGYAIGGLSVGESREDMAEILPTIVDVLPQERPRYLMGVGMPRDILCAVSAGVDMFDCVLPTRNGRNSYAFTAYGPIRLRNEKYTRDERPLEENCDCETCRNHSRAYLRHLFNVKEMLGPTLTSIHNLRFFQRFMARVRDLIMERRLVRIVEEFPISAWERVDQESQE